MRKIGLCMLLMLCICAHALAMGEYREIEELWEIEDTHTESSSPLFTEMRNNGIPMAWDEGSGTFYCALNLEQGETWPELSLEVPGAAEGLEVCFADEYTADSCAGAMADGTAYQMMAWTDTQYWYFNIVFSGMPFFSISTESEISREDTPAGIVYSSAEGKMETDGRVHYRGDSTAAAEKHNYKLEFLDEPEGKKTAREIPGFMETKQVILLPMSFDRSSMRDRLSWEAYGMISGEDTMFRARRAAYTELFVNGSYEGVYLMIEPIKVKDELDAEDARKTDSVYRTTLASNVGKRKLLEDTRTPFMGYELFYTRQDGEFGQLQEYLELWNEEDDEVFKKKAEEIIDIDNFLRYDLFVQAAGLSDNFFNNLFIRAHGTENGIVYSYYPWDMDLSWGKNAGENSANWFPCPIADRILELDVCGARERFAQLWKQFQEQGIREDVLLGRIEQYAHELRDSGAIARNMERWPEEDYDPEGYNVIEFVSVRFALLDNAAAKISEGKDSLDFLTAFYRDGSTGVIPEE